jgi:hypothetical protein
MKTYEIKLKIKLPKYPKWIIGYVEEGLEQGEAVVEYDITPEGES